MPLVSVIMPSYNHARFIGESIESVLDQDCQDLELVIVDDASADDSRRVIEAYQTKDSRIRAFFHETNMGIAKTVNEAFDATRGRFVAHISSDDLWVKHKLQRQLAILEEDDNLVVYGDIQSIDAEGDAIASEKAKQRKRPEAKRSGDILPDLIEGNFVGGQSMIYKRENAQAIRHDEELKYVNDWKYVLDLAERCKFHFIPECLAKYRIHGKNSISRDAAGWLSDFALFGKYVLDKHGDQLSRKTKAKFLFRIGCDAQLRADRKDARKWMLKAITNHPFNKEYYAGFLSSFGKGATIPRSIRRRVLS
jgi:glycosyltransferase involved in cell wall biosynthesis